MKLTYRIALTSTVILLGACSGRTTFGNAENGVTNGNAGAGGDANGMGMDGTENTSMNGGEVTEPGDEGTEPSEMEPGTENPGEEMPGEENPGEEMPGEELPGEEMPGEETPGEYDPCADKACGDSCSLCAPDDAECVETDEIKLCNSSGLCESAVGERPACGATCANADECVRPSFAAEECLVCADGNVRCDRIGCVEGKCVVQDPEPCDERRECAEALDCRAGANDALIAPPADFCRVCPNGDTVCPEPACVEGQCVERIPACDEEPKECSDAGDCALALLVACRLCDDEKTSACPTVDCVEGQCVTKINECPGEGEYDPCDGKDCGATCSACNPENSSCAPLVANTVCNAEGACVVRTEEAPVCSGEYDPCANKACGDTCNLCSPNDANCVETGVIKACNKNGECVNRTGDAPACEPEYDPCAGKECGDTCTLCAPDDTDCGETAEVKVCNAEGQCGSLINDGPDCSAE